MSYVTTEPLLSGRLDVGQGHSIFWSEAGNPLGKPVLVLHGGPGAGSSPSHRKLFDPSRYRIVQFDQRNCGRSTPHASEPLVDLSTNTTQYLISDIEDLRTELCIDRWLVWGGSWGTTLGLAYAMAHSQSVTELLLAAVVSTNSIDVEWVTRTVGRVFPQQWQAFRDHLPPDRRNGNLTQAYNDLLMNPEPAIHAPAASAWCHWEEAHVSMAPDHRPDPRYSDPRFRLAFARIVTHYWANAAFLDDNHLLRNAHRLADIPTFLAHGRLDISSPLDFPLELAAAIPATKVFVADNDGHSGAAISNWTISITDSLAD
ncbi:MAG: prolyl aminopeptidase [Acidimicrobiia bacterium]